MFAMKNTNNNNRILHSSPSRRKVNFHNFRDSTTVVQNAPDKVYENGLDLSLFEGRVDTDLVCSLCNRVFVLPEVSVCQHIFCNPCLRRNVNKECPTCSNPLDLMPSQQPPVQLRRRLLDLMIHCDHKCGQIMPLGQLPQHVSQECPNSPVSCHHGKKGCKMKVKRCQLVEHMKECGWRPVECEACGEKTVYNELHLHQKKSRCVENRIRNQLVQAIKSTNQEARKHKKSIEHQRVQIESQQRRNELDHVRRQQSLKSQQQRQGILNSHHTQLSLYKESSFLSPQDNRSTTHAKDTNSIDYSRQRHNIDLTPKFAPINIKSTPIRNATSPTRPTSKQIFERNNSMPNTTTTVPSLTNGNTTGVFVTDFNGALDDSVNDPSGQVNGHESVPLSRGTQDIYPFVCRRCCKRVTGGNKPNSCRWHAGPIIELFGGTCYTCGRLDYQHGCMIGYHEI